MDLFSAALGYIVKAFSENTEAKNFKNDFFGAFVEWVRPVFLKDDKTAELVLTSTGADELKKQIIQDKLETLWKDEVMRTELVGWVTKIQQSSVIKEKHVLRGVEMEMDGDITIWDKNPAGDKGQYDRKGVIENSKLKGKNFRLGDG